MANPADRPSVTHATGCLLLGGLLSAACQTEPARVVVDSRIVVARVAVLADETTAEFGVAGTIGQWAAAPVDVGRVAFLDYERNRVVVVDTTGRVVAAFGRKGGGPGEFANPRFLVRTDSGLAVYDGLKFALVTFDLDGRSRTDIPQTATIGIPDGQPTGMAPLANGSWAYSVTEHTGSSFRESLYLRSNGVSLLLARTAEVAARVLRLPCGITMSGGAPVFWPTLRWVATPTHVAYAATALDRVVVWDVARGDSTVFLGNAKPLRATKAAALAATDGYTVETPGKRCAIERQQVLEQRGMMKTMPPIERLALSPAGVLWVRLTARPGEPSVIRVHDGATTESLVSGAFPGFFLSDTRFVAEEKDSADRVVASLWEVRRRR